ncbi:hypothetical protein ACGFYF_41175 [Streptomyces lavendulae]|uniref:hypothetical protein n=1 Tax=Streptomyces lavendulae TaxID=1914 RepID=UPI003723D146
MEPESDWVRLLAEYAPPHPEGSWFEPLLWPLLQAASDLPALREVYPSLVMNCLVVYRNREVWKSAPADRWPAASVGSDGVYAVISDAWSGEAKVFLATTDPILAAVELGKLIDAIRKRR